MPGALKYRNFRLFLFGQSISLIGTWMQQVAMGWLVYDRTRSGLRRARSAFAASFPASSSRRSRASSPIAGTGIARSSSCKRLPCFRLSSWPHWCCAGVVEVWHIGPPSAFLGVVTAFEVPARQAFSIQMVEGREALSSAIGLNSSMFNAARVIGPALAGFTIEAHRRRHLLPAQWAELHRRNRRAFGDAASAARAGLAAAARARRAGRGSPLCRRFSADPRNPPAAGLREPRLDPAVERAAAGFRQERAGGRRSHARHVEAGDRSRARSGALRLAFRKSVLGLGRQIAWSAALFGAGMIAFSFSPVLWLSMARLRPPATA